MNPGKLRHKMDVYGNVKGENEVGETTFTFQKIGSIRAEIIPQTGALQRQTTETLLTNVTHKIKVRYSAGKDITKDMKLYFRNHKFEIKYILNPYFQNEWLEIFCEELLE